MRSMRRSVAVAVSASVALAACGGGSQPSLRLGARAIALDLAFAKKELAQPVAPEVIVQIIPAPPQVASGQMPLESAAVPPNAPTTLPPPCAAAPPGTAPAAVAPVGITRPPRPGRYKRHNSGTFGIKAGALDLRLPFPPETFDDVSPAREVAPQSMADAAANLVGAGKPAPNQPGSGVFEWDVRQEITASFVITTTYRLTRDALAIVRRVTTTMAGESAFSPSPPVTVMELNQGVGRTWRSAGVDSDSRTALFIDGTIKATEPVDLCGAVVDSFRVATSETFANLATGESSGTNGAGNVYNVATQLGGLFVSTEQHYTQQTRDKATGTPIVLSFDYVSTMNRPEPTAQVAP